MNVIAQMTADPTWPSGGDVTRGLFALFVVFGLLLLLAWAAKRGLLSGLAGFGRQGRSPVVVEGSLPLGERRSLLIVSIEGRRLLLGLTPMQVSLVTELGAAAAPPAATGRFDETLARSIAAPPSSPSSSSSSGAPLSSSSPS